jgi:hypothetical protein
VAHRAAAASTGTIDSLINGLTTTYAVCAAILVAAAITAIATLSPRRSSSTIAHRPPATKETARIN